VPRPRARPRHLRAPRPLRLLPARARRPPRLRAGARSL